MITRSLLSAGRRIFATSYRQLTFDVTCPQDFDEKVLKASKPVVVDFHASWCQPCKLLTPILEDGMEKFEDKIDLAKIDVDENSDLAMEYGVMSVPTVLAIKGGEVVDQFIGVKNEQEMQKFLEDLL